MIHWSSHKTDTGHTYREEMNWVITASLAILAVVALAVALIYTRKLMIPFVVALFIVALVSPIEDFQVKWLRLPRVIAVIVTLLIVLAVMALVSLFLVQSSRTIAYTAGEYSTSFYNLASRILKPLEYIYKLEEPPQPVVPEAPKLRLGTTPSDLGPVENKPEAVELFPVVKDADKPAVLDVRPYTRPPTLPKAKGFDNSVLLNEGPQPSPPASAQGADQSAAPRGSAPPASAALTKDANKPVAPAASSVPSTPAKDANEVVGAAAEPNEAAKSQWRIDTRQIVADLIANVRQIMRDMANHMFVMLRNTVGAVFGLLSGVLFVCIFVIFLLAGRNPYAEHSQMYRDVVVNMRRYLGTKVLTSALVGVLVWASLAIIGMELAGVFGVLAFLLNFIPVIGPVIVTVLPIPLAMAQFQSLWPVILVVVVPGGIHNVIGNIIEPKLIGKGLDLHPVTIMLALSFWGLLWGIVGMFLAAPITAAIRIVLMQFDTFKPIANLLAGDFQKPEREPPAVSLEATRPATPPSEAESAGSLR
jgi:predicted PurR-regulated permease PerM